VFKPDRPHGTVDRAAYVFCVLEQFHRHLLRRDIYASPSARWGDPRAKLLTGPAWDAARAPALNALGLPEDPSELLAEHAQELDGAWRALSDGLVAGSEVDVDADGRLHADKIDAIADPPSLVDSAPPPGGHAAPRRSSRPDLGGHGVAPRVRGGVRRGVRRPQPTRRCARHDRRGANRARAERRLCPP
jgi:hypothetical protein